MTLRQLREAAGLSQVRLARLADIEQTTISQLELGKIRKPTYITVRALARALNVGSDDIAAAIEATTHDEVVPS